MNQKDPTAINKAAGLSQVGESEKHYFSMLPVGQGIVKLQDRWLRPFLVNFPLVNVKKGMVTDSVLGQFLKDKKTLSDFRERASIDGFSVWNGRKRDQGISVGNRRFRFGANVLEKGGWLFLQDIVRYPEDPVSRRYKRLKVSVEKGNKWKLQLIENGLIQPEQVKVGRTYKLLLRPTEFARKFLLSEKGIDGQASLQHEYWKQVYAQKFSEKDYHVILECPRTAKGNFGRMDLLAWRASESVESVAVEIETGKSDVVSNVKRDLREEVRKVLVVATDEGALKKVERQLAEEVLLIPGRVEVVLRDELPIS